MPDDLGRTVTPNDQKNERAAKKQQGIDEPDQANPREENDVPQQGKEDVGNEAFIASKSGFSGEADNGVESEDESEYLHNLTRDLNINSLAEEASRSKGKTPERDAPSPLNQGPAIQQTQQTQEQPLNQKQQQQQLSGYYQLPFHPIQYPFPNLYEWPQGQQGAPAPGFHPPPQSPHPSQGFSFPHWFPVPQSPYQQEIPTQRPPPPQQYPFYYPFPPYPYYPRPANDLFESAILAVIRQDEKSIKKLNDHFGWWQWNKNLKTSLDKIGYWEILTVGSPKPTHPHDLATWADQQNRLGSLLYLVCGNIPRSKLTLHDSKTAAEKYQMLKSDYDIHTVGRFNNLYFILYRSKLTAYKNHRLYAEAMIRARDELASLGRPQDEMLISYTYLHGLGSEWASWREKYMDSWNEGFITYDQQGKRILTFPTIDQIVDAAETARERRARRRQ